MKPPHHVIWVTHSQRYPAVDPVRLYQDALTAGLSAMILREKQMPTEELYHLAKRLWQISQSQQAYLSLAGNADLCHKLGLPGLHLPGGSHGLSSLRSIVGAQVTISQSVHDLYQAERAQIEGADFLVAGSVFPTRSHDGEPLGIAGLIQICSTVKIPVYAIGGITTSNVSKVRDAGAYGALVVGALYDSENLPETIAGLNEPWV